MVSCISPDTPHPHPVRLMAGSLEIYRQREGRETVNSKNNLHVEILIQLIIYSSVGYISYRIQKLLGLP
jgi:hypothetical protein